MIEQLNKTLFVFINQYVGINPFVNDIVTVVAQYLPVIFVILIIYLWIKKGDKHKDIILYCIYASILGLITTSIMDFFYSMQSITSAGTFSNNIIFMLSVALMMTYFQETRKIGAILLILGLNGSFIMIIPSMNFPLDLFEPFGVAIISTIIIYSLKKKLTSLNQIFKLIYLILK